MTTHEQPLPRFLVYSALAEIENKLEHIGNAVKMIRKLVDSSPELLQDFAGELRDLTEDMIESVTHDSPEPDIRAELEESGVTGIVEAYLIGRKESFEEMREFFAQSTVVPTQQ